jgi:hypothetical protein
MRTSGGLLLLATAALSTGCAAERTLRVTSEPLGAEVRVDGELRGATPVDVEFAHYGTRRVVLRRDGYGTATLRVALEPPWYARFPVDLVSEVLLPIGWKDQHAVHAVLLPGEDKLALSTLRSVLDRAEMLRRAGAKGPEELPPAVEAEALVEPR